jgi:hypothetical protein
MLNHGRGYTSPPQVLIDQTFRNTASSSGQVPLVAEMTPTYLVEPNFYYTIKAEGFHFNRTLYTNQDFKALPTIAICSTSEIINNEDYVELVLPAQVINEFVLQITERSGEGLDVNRNLIMLLEIVELDDKHYSYVQSNRQRY